MFVKKVRKLSDSFIMGMDASCVPSLEASGVKYYDHNGNEKDVYQILAENGADSLQITKFLSPQYFRKGQSNQDMLVSFADKVAKNVSIPVVLGGEGQIWIKSSNC